MQIIAINHCLWWIKNNIALLRHKDSLKTNTQGGSIKTLSRRGLRGEALGEWQGDTPPEPFKEKKGHVGVLGGKGRTWEGRKVDIRSRGKMNTGR